MSPVPCDLPDDTTRTVRRLYTVAVKNANALFDVVLVRARGARGGARGRSKRCGAQGDNRCGIDTGASALQCCEYGFSATPGWDAVSGWGTPNFAVLANEPA